MVVGRVGHWQHYSCGWSWHLTWLLHYSCGWSWHLTWLQHYGCGWSWHLTWLLPHGCGWCWHLIWLLPHGCGWSPVSNHSLAWGGQLDPDSLCVCGRMTVLCCCGWTWPASCRTGYCRRRGHQVSSSPMATMDATMSMTWKTCRSSPALMAAGHGIRLVMKCDDGNLLSTPSPLALYSDTRNTQTQSQA